MKLKSLKSNLIKSKKMKNRKGIATFFILLSVVLGVIFYTNIDYPSTVEDYFKKSYYGQFGPLAICVELLIAGYYLFKGHKKSNFALALFASTALMDVLFNLAGLFTSAVPLYAMALFVICAIISIWISFSNAFNLGRITSLAAVVSFILGSIIEIYFNYLQKIRQIAKAVLQITGFLNSDSK